VCRRARPLPLRGAGRRALIAIVALLGACLALQAPQAAVGLVLAERGRVESAVVTSVEGGPSAVSSRGRYLCSKGRVPPRGVEAGAARSAPLRGLGGWVAALVIVCVIAVVRSYRISHTASDPPVVPSSAAGP
jgi:hypothetical protein